jgi:hypothetical protein
VSGIGLKGCIARNRLPAMLYDSLTTVEAMREIERLQYELEELRDTKTKPDQQRELEKYIQRLLKIGKRGSP